MEIYKSKKFEGKIKKDFFVPGSKSITNRAFFLSCLGSGKSFVINPLKSDDTEVMITAMKILGAGIEEIKSSGIWQKGTIGVHGFGGNVVNGDKKIYLGNAGTAVRFMTALAGIQKKSSGTIEISGNSRMNERPLKDLIEGIKQFGAKVESSNFCTPVLIEGGEFFPEKIKIKGNTSSQYLSGVLQVAPLLEKGLKIEIDGELVSKPYIDLTIDVMSKFGVFVKNNNYESFEVENQKYCSLAFEVEADASSSSYPFALGFLHQSEITVNIPYSSKQGDAKFVDVLEKAGAKIIKNEKTMTIIGPKEFGELGEIDMNAMPDVAMTLAIIAPFLKGKTIIKNVENMRVKETDRIKALITELKKIGVECEELKDGMIINHCEKFNTDAIIDTYDDHRMAMCFGILGTKIGGIQIKDPFCTKKTYPAFFEDLEKIYL